MCRKTDLFINMSASCPISSLTTCQLFGNILHQMLLVFLLLYVMSCEFYGTVFAEIAVIVLIMLRLVRESSSKRSKSICT